MSEQLPEGWKWETSLFCVRGNSMIYTDDGSTWHATENGEPVLGLNDGRPWRSAARLALALNEKYPLEETHDGEG
jgi:hypothetical protein